MLSSWEPNYYHLEDRRISSGGHVFSLAAGGIVIDSTSTVPLSKKGVGEAAAVVTFNSHTARVTKSSGFRAAEGAAHTNLGQIAGLAPGRGCG
jgi:hypothetical protein